MYDVRLNVNGVAYGGFRSGEFKLSMEQVCNDFSLVYSDAWTERGESVPIVEGNRCKLTVNGNVMIDGWVDEATTEYTPVHFSLGVSGRSSACDIVDCSTLTTAGCWSNQKVSEIALDLCYPFSAVRVRTLGDDGAPIPKFVLQRGETVGAALLRAARLRSMLVYTAGENLVLAKVGTQRTTTVLRRGGTVIEGSRRASMADRFSDYVFKGQTRARDEVNGVAANQIRGTVTDNNVPRYRPMLIIAGGADGPSDLGARAIMERNQRAGRAERITLKVEGWMTDEGYLWEPNILVRVTDDWLGIDQDLVVVSASFSFHGDTGAGGFTTSLELCDPRAFDMGDAPLIRRRRRASTWLAGVPGDGSALFMDNPNPFPRTGSIDGDPSNISHGPLRAGQNEGGRGIYAVAPTPQPSANAGNRGHRRHRRNR